ncbi:MAG: TGS domain-containing protein, partial [Pseudohongiella sp.]|nr:TGS domain-containing protein [Pseudohongiella sp.]
VLVPDVRDCYAALGIVHNIWRVIPNEFDDYIANPKENGYQSLHTAVIGPHNKVFEIQIRTYAMDDDAELGVCAHWRYKEGIVDPNYKDGFEEKIEWLRQVLAWHDEMGMVGGLAEQLRSDARADDRIYVFTPEGHVVDLMAGATPLDFAYYVHTEVGHHCSGARVNDKVVALNYRLKTGDRVEVLSSPLNSPVRDWLKPHLGYANTPRSRAKLVQWFKLQDKDQNLEYGKEWLETEFKRLAVRHIPYEDIAKKLGCKNVDGLFVSVGTGAIAVDEVIDVVRLLSADLVPADLFAGMHSENSEEQTRSIHLGILAHDRAGLLRDVSAILAAEGIYVLAINTRSNKQAATAYMQLEIEADSFTRLARALDHLNDLDSVIEATRLEDQ